MDKVYSFRPNLHNWIIFPNIGNASLSLKPTCNTSISSPHHKSLSQMFFSEQDWHLCWFLALFGLILKCLVLYWNAGFAQWLREAVYPSAFYFRQSHWLREWDIWPTCDSLKLSKRAKVRSDSIISTDTLWQKEI